MPKHKLAEQELNRTLHQMSLAISPGVEELKSTEIGASAIREIVKWLGSQDYNHAAAYDDRLCTNVCWILQVTKDDAVLQAMAGPSEPTIFQVELPRGQAEPMAIEIVCTTTKLGWKIQLTSEVS